MSEPVVSAFEGWRGDFVGFYRGLELDNSKAYFENHRRQYEEAVRGPMVALLAELEPEFGAGRVARPNRDIRFSADKSPYKLSIYANTPGGHVGLDAQGLVAAAGRYMLEPSQLPRFREAVAAGGSGRALAAIVGRLAGDGYEIGGRELKRVPAPHPPDHERADLLRYKRLYFWRRWEVGPWLADGDQVKERVAAVWRDGRPLEEWFAKHLG